MWWHQGSHKAIKSTTRGEKKRRRGIRGEREGRFRTFLKGTTGRHIVLFGVSGGSNSLISSHKSSGTILIV